MIYTVTMHTIEITKMFAKKSIHCLLEQLEKDHVLQIFWCIFYGGLIR